MEDNIGEKVDGIHTCCCGLKDEDICALKKNVRNHCHAIKDHKEKHDKKHNDLKM